LAVPISSTLAYNYTWFGKGFGKVWKGLERFGKVWKRIFELKNNINPVPNNNPK
jgi:hypothetical protein